MFSECQGGDVTPVGGASGVGGVLNFLSFYYSSVYLHLFYARLL